MSRAVQFQRDGGIDVFEIVDVAIPAPGSSEVVVAVRAAGLNPGEASIREGELHEQWPATFPSGQGSDLAGTATAVGDGVRGFEVGDEVLGFTDARPSQAEHVAVPFSQVVPEPSTVPWEQAGALEVPIAAVYPLEAVRDAYRELERRHTRGKIVLVP